jgi:hypothetical protein
MREICLSSPLRAERLDFAVPPPELYIMAIDKLFAHSIGLFVIGANQFYCSDKMTVRTTGCRLGTLPSTARREPGSAQGQCEQYCTPSKQTQHNFAVSVHPPPVQCVLVFPAISLSQASAHRVSVLSRPVRSTARWSILRRVTSDQRRSLNRRAQPACQAGTALED